MYSSEYFHFGFSAQPPIGEGCKVRFEGIEIIDNNYKNIRKPE